MWCSRPDVTGDDALATALQDHVKREIAPYKYPRAIEFVAQLPKTETGKLQRFALRQMAQARPRNENRHCERAKQSAMCRGMIALAMTSRLGEYL